MRSRVWTAMLVIALVAGCTPGVAAGAPQAAPAAVPAGSVWVPARPVPATHSIGHRALLRGPGYVVDLVSGKKKATGR